MIESVEDALIRFVQKLTQRLRKLFRKGKSRHGSTKKKRFSLRDIILVTIAVLLVLFGAGLLWFSSIQIPDLASFDQRIIGNSTKIYDRTGTILLYDMGQNMRHTEIPFDQISPNIKNATIAIEDAGFYSHGGIQITSIIRAAFADISSGELSQGGSTITQQVVKNALLTQNKTISRKIEEIFLAIKLEKTLSKDQILNLYLNENPYGGTIYGVEEASEEFFGKSSSDVDVAQAAYIAAIPQSPTYYSPFGQHKTELDARKDLVLEKMKENGYITEAQYEAAKAEKVVFNTESTGGIKAPHFSMYIENYLENKYGSAMVTTGGLKVITTLDYNLEGKAESIVKQYATTDAKLYHATNAAMVTIDPATGQILTMTGSRDFFDTTIDGQFNVATALRQPGSSFKPFVYAQAFNDGYTPETVLFDLPTEFNTNCAVDDFTSDETTGCYAPQDYDNEWRGPMTLRNALAQSINLPAVKLLYLVGINNAIDLATKMGITTLTDPSRYGLSLVLGGGEVTLLDMTSAYGVFADEGVRHPDTGILKVTDKDGNILEQYQDNSTTVLPKDTALTVSDILSDNTARTPVFGAASSLYFPGRAVAAKTGTTNDYRDTWVVGYTPQIAVGAWMGNNDNTPIAKQVAGYIVAPMWHAYMNELLSTLPNVPFEKEVPPDPTTLKPVMKGIWLNTTTGIGPDGMPVAQNSVHDILYYVDKSNPLGPGPTNPAADPQYQYWEYSVQQWAATKGYASTAPAVPGTIGSTPVVSPTTPSTLSVSIATPQQNAVIPVGTRMSVNLGTASNYPIIKADFYLNDIYIGSNNNQPYNFLFTLDANTGTEGANTLKVIVTDQSGAQKTATVTFVKQ